jgi:hypothetical protein
MDGIKQAGYKLYGWKEVWMKFQQMQRDILWSRMMSVKFIILDHNMSTIGLYA